MKRSMWGVDATGGFHFSDCHAAQPSLLTYYGQEWLANALSQALAGHTLTVGQVKRYVLVETPCCLHKKALNLLENRGRIEPVDPPTNRRKGTFPNEDMRIRFALLS